MESITSNNTLNLSCLKKGKIFSSYAQLCHELGVSPKAGNSRQPQKDFFRRFFDFEEIPHSNSLRITEIYESPQPEKPRTRNKPSEYGELIFPIILLTVQNQREAKNELYELPNDRSIAFTKTNLLFKFGFFNRLYYNILSATDLEKPSDEFVPPAKSFGTPPKESLYRHTEAFKFYSETVNTRFISSLSSICWNIFSRYFKRCLDNLVKLNKIRYQEKYYFYDKDESKYRYASNTESTLIKADEIKALAHIGCKSTYEARIKFKYKEFQAIRDEWLALKKIENLRTIFVITIFGKYETAYKAVFAETLSETEQKQALIDYREKINQKLIKLAQNAITKKADKLYDDIINYSTLSAPKQNEVKFIKIYLKRQNLIDDDSSAEDIKNAYIQEGLLFVTCCINHNCNPHFANIELSKRLDNTVDFNLDDNFIF